MVCVLTLSDRSWVGVVGWSPSIMVSDNGMCAHLECGRYVGVPV